MKESPVVAFVRLAWENAGGQFSWERYNHQVRETCHIAADGFDWRDGDMSLVMAFSNKRCTIMRCLCENGDEALYRTAVKAGNMSACVEMERYFDRAPIIADDVTYAAWDPRFKGNRKRGRICMDARFRYGESYVRVTSFGDDGRAVCVPCEGARKILRIGPDEIKADRKARKEAAK